MLQKFQFLIKIFDKNSSVLMRINYIFIRSNNNITIDIVFIEIFHNRENENQNIPSILSAIIKLKIFY